VVLADATARVLVTGAGGFVGRHLVRRLLAEGRSVHCILKGGEPAEQVPVGFEAASCLYYDGSIESLFDVVEAAEADTVFHLASLFRAQHTTAEVGPLVLSNVLFGTQLLEALARLGQPQVGFVNIGTSWQHFQDADYDPVCLYAATKQAFVDVMRYYVNAEGLRAVTLSFFDTYGADDPRPKLFGLLREAAERETPLAMSPGEQVLDIVHIDDIVEALLTAERLLSSGRIGDAEEFAISSGHRMTLRQVSDVYASATGLTPNIEWGGRPYRTREVMVPWQTGTPLPEWTAKITLEDGLRRLEEGA
jgi:nucleoside-diphosphate-sugar epimerase